MVTLYKPELKKLERLCEYRIQDITDALENPKTTGLDIALAKMECDYLRSLLDKLNGIISSDAKRIEVK